MWVKPSIVNLYIRDRTMLVQQSDSRSKVGKAKYQSKCCELSRFIKIEIVICCHGGR